MPPDVELEQKLQKALVECEKLRSENADLKAKLNLEVNALTPPQGAGLPVVPFDG